MVGLLDETYALDLIEAFLVLLLPCSNSFWVLEVDLYLIDSLSGDLTSIGFPLCLRVTSLSGEPHLNA